MSTANFQTDRYVRKNECFPFNWGTVQGTARALANFRRVELSQAEADKIDSEPGVRYVGHAEVIVERVPRIIVRSQTFTENMPAYKLPWACISITGPRDGDACVPTANRVGILRLKFDDSTPTSPWYHRTDVLFTPAQARQVLAFAQEVWPKIKILHVHCWAGISRSSGTAAALSTIYFGDDGEFVKNDHYSPNSLVYRTILTLYQEAIAAAS